MTTIVRVGDPALAWRPAPQPQLTALFSPRRPASWEDVESELAEAFTLSRNAMERGGVAIFLLRSDAVLGLGDAADAALCGALLGGVRTLALEGRRRGLRAHAICLDPAVPANPDPCIEWLCNSGATGCVIHLSDSHLGKVPA